jgi:hypothetical protein
VVFTGSGDRWRDAAGLLLVVGLSDGVSGWGWERADAVEGCDVVAVPGPAGWEVQRLAACVAGQEDAAVIVPWL